MLTNKQKKALGKFVHTCNNLGLDINIHRYEGVQCDGTLDSYEEIQFSPNADYIPVDRALKLLKELVEILDGKA